MTELEPVGNYAVQPTFSTATNSGIFTWDYLYELGAGGAAVGPVRGAPAGCRRSATRRCQRPPAAACGHHH
jgi:hypothetical protein